MLDPTVELWVAGFQNVAAIGTAAAFIFISLQAWWTRGQLKIVEREFIIRKRPWIYRDPELDPKKDYMLLDDSKYNERYVRVPFINRGERLYVVG